MVELPLQHLEYPNLGTWLIVRLCFSFWLDAQFATTSGHHPHDMILGMNISGRRPFLCFYFFCNVKVVIIISFERGRDGRRGGYTFGWVERTALLNSLESTRVFPVKNEYFFRISGIKECICFFTKTKEKPRHIDGFL